MVEHADEVCCVPPGFRFHPTEEELVGYYLARKVMASQQHDQIDLDVIQEVDLYGVEPWDLQRIVCSGSRYAGGDDQQQQEWYFFSHKDRKYPSGTRTNRATAAGFWKATGRDKPVLSSSSAGCGRRVVIGMRKTLVFYKGRAPNGSKTDWIMHEYRLHQSADHHSQRQEEGWVVCRAFRKPIPNQQHQQQIRTPLLSYHHHQPSPSPSCCSYPLPAGGYGGGDHHLFMGSTTSSLQPSLYPTAAVVDDDELLRLIQQQQGGGGQAAAAGAAIDWNFLDTLLLSSSTVLHDPSSSSLQLQ